MNIRKYLEYPFLPPILSLIVTFFEFIFMATSLPMNILLFIFQYIAFSVVLERHTILADLLKLARERTAVFVDREHLPGLTEVVGKANKSLWIEAISFGRLCSERQLLANKYKDGCEIKLLLLNPKHATEASKMIQNLDETTMQHQIEDTIRFILKSKEKSPKGGIITGKLLPSNPGFGVFITDGDTDNGEVKVELMPCGTLPAEGPNVIITKSQDLKRYRQFIEHFNNLWEKSDPMPEQFKG
jgi:hypothetical protein